MFRTPPPSRSTSTSGSQEKASGAQQHTENPFEVRPQTRSRGPATFEGLPARTRREHRRSESDLRSSADSDEKLVSARPASVVNCVRKLNMADSERDLNEVANNVQPVAQNQLINNVLPGAPNEPVNNAQNMQQPANIVRENRVPANGEQAQIPVNANRILPVNAIPQPNMEDWRHLLRALVRNNMQLPEFSGQGHEDPENFIRECEQTFDASQTEMHLRSRLASRALKDDAARWFAVYKSLNLTWVKFCELLRNRFAAPTTMMKLSAKLYGQPQSDKESTSVFLEQRHLLVRRLFPDAPEQQIVGILVESLRASTKKLLRSSVFEMVGDLVIRAKQIEQDEAEERNANRRSAQTPTPAVSAKPRTNTQLPALSQNLFNNDKPKSAPPQLPRCHHCPGRHWNRDCPRNPRFQTRKTTPGHRQTRRTLLQQLIISRVCLLGLFARRVPTNYFKWENNVRVNRFSC